jgi:excisionase family DNA binding protein
MSDILTIPQLAARLQVSERKVYELTRKRNRDNQRHPLPLVRIGRCVRFKADEIEKWIDRLQQEAR